jgi:hypothetical protein
VRLPLLERGATWKTRLLYKLVPLLQRDRMPDVVRVLRHRPARFGAPFSRLCQAVLRGPSPWTVGERELMAAFVSDRNRCRF